MEGGSFTNRGSTETVHRLHWFVKVLFCMEEMCNICFASGQRSYVSQRVGCYVSVTSLRFHSSERWAVILVLYAHWYGLHFRITNSRHFYCWFSGCKVLRIPLAYFTVPFHLAKTLWIPLDLYRCSRYSSTVYHWQTT
jgi:hypothetical protein